MHSEFQPGLVFARRHASDSKTFTSQLHSKPIIAAAFDEFEVKSQEKVVAKPVGHTF